MIEAASSSSRRAGWAAATKLPGRPTFNHDLVGEEQVARRDEQDPQMLAGPPHHFRPQVAREGLHTCDLGSCHRLVPQGVNHGRANMAATLHRRFMPAEVSPPPPSGRREDSPDQSELGEQPPAELVGVRVRDRAQETAQPSAAVAANGRASRGTVVGRLRRARSGACRSGRTTSCLAPAPGTRGTSPPLHPRRPATAPNRRAGAQGIGPRPTGDRFRHGGCLPA